MLGKMVRYGSLPGIGTFGELRIANERFYTVELEWLENRRRVSCIPDGFYDLVPHSSGTYPNVWAMVGKGVSHYEEPGVARFACLIHIANWPQDVKGCIGIGRRLMEISGRHGVKLGVSSSAASIGRLRNILNSEEKNQISITWKELGESTHG